MISGVACLLTFEMDDATFKRHMRLTNSKPLTGDSVKWVLLQLNSEEPIEYP